MIARTPTSTYSPSLDNLRSLLMIRCVALLGQVGVLAYVVALNRTTENLFGLAASLVGLGLLTVASFWRLGRRWPVSDAEFLTQLLLDVAGWTALMYFTGGASNPFISYYIVPLVVAAAVLPWRHTWLVAGTALLAYSVLLYHYRPFPLFSPHAMAGHGDAGSAHVLGMWFNFLFSAALITYFVVRMAAQLRLQQERATAHREQRLRHDQILAVASLAAGTAHELGTPLGTMTVLVDEMLADPALIGDLREDCVTLREQLAQCRATLATLTRTAETDDADGVSELEAREFVEDTVRRWAVRRPGVDHRLQCDTEGLAPRIGVDTTIAQALENLLNNAADSGTDQVEIRYDWNPRELRIQVRDQGRGIDPKLLESLGKPIIHPSRAGLGIGLLLSHASVERVGGRIELRNASPRGTIATLYLPLLPKASDD
ncbi:HAMP domain-containing histidine kinase [Mangrovimicrobium sediminis]|uniref:histidine kinase n=1 Tax=Mangrovimicrobium sediminis TaxID=2562682 RepID=A0A4Z0M477_9GAMM|nr:ATP-binding protein [Haliea sp. SAOS-164]TGD74237.1 HAMP domain-containing histidine kinase [Haliea sp. SAOS-164]